MPTFVYTRSQAAQHAQAMIGAFLARSIDTVGRVTDFNVGSVMRSLFEAVALRIEAIETGFYLGLQRAIPTVVFEFFGEGDGVTSTVGFPALPALPASGVARFTRAVGDTGTRTVPIGTRLTVPAVGAVPAKVYRVTVPLTLPNGVMVGETLVTAQAAGVLGNTPANTMALTDIPTGFASATNPAALVNGAEAETDEARRQRFTPYLRNLARAQHAGLEVGALQARVLTAGQVTERVQAVRSVNVPEKRGLVHVYIDNGGGGASAALVADAQARIDGGFAIDGSRVHGYKAAGEVVIVRAVVPQVVPVTARIRLEPGFTWATVGSLVETAIAQHLFGIGVFADLVVAELIAAIVTVRGVADVALETPTANVPAGTGARILAGAITLTQETA